jgi:hypothetical protein
VTISNRAGHRKVPGPVCLVDVGGKKEKGASRQIWRNWAARYFSIAHIWWLTPFSLDTFFSVSSGE